jgi:hypothetical protein
VDSEASEIRLRNSGFPRAQSMSALHLHWYLASFTRLANRGGGRRPSAPLSFRVCKKRTEISLAGGAWPSSLIILGEPGLSHRVEQFIE